MEIRFNLISHCKYCLNVVLSDVGSGPGMSLCEYTVRTANNPFNPKTDPDTYIYDQEVEPAPGVGEVLDEAVGHPFQQHLQDEDVGEDLVCIFQHGLDGPPLFYVDVLERLHGGGTKKKKCLLTY